MSLLRALKARPFTLFFTGQFISGLGDSIYGIAIAWWIADQADSAEVMGQVLALAFLPRLIFLFIGGVIGDRLPRLKVVLVTSVAQGLVIALIALLAAPGRLESWHIYSASLLAGIMAALAYPAYTAMIPDVTSNEDLFSANSLLSLGAHMTGVIGPGLGALLVEQVGYPIAFALDALSFFVSAVFLAAMQPYLPVNRTFALGTIHLCKDWSEGWQFVAKQRWLWVSMLILLWVNFTGRSTMNVALPFLIERELRAGVGVLGLLQSAFGLGSILGAVWVGQRMKVDRKGWVIYGSLFATGLLTAALGLPLPLMALVASMLLIGACLAINNLLWSVVLQERVPRTVLGRVASISNMSSTALLPLGFSLAGIATDLVGASQVFLLGGVLTALLALAGLWLPTTRRL